MHILHQIEKLQETPAIWRVIEITSTPRKGIIGLHWLEHSRQSGQKSADHSDAARAYIETSDKSLRARVHDAVPDTACGLGSRAGRLSGGNRSYRLKQTQVLILVLQRQDEGNVIPRR